jgi:hypothetical protein
MKAMQRRMGIEKVCFMACPVRDDEFRIDDQSASDLDVDEVFLRLDETRTNPGQAVLYSWLRNSCASSQALEERLSFSRSLEADSGTRERLGRILGKLGWQAEGDVALEIWGATGDGYLKWRGAFIAYYAVMILAVGASFVFSFAPAVITLLFIVGNIAIFSKTHGYIGRHSGSIAYLFGILSAAKRIDKAFPGAVIPGARSPLAELVRGANRVPKGILLFVARTGSAFVANPLDIVVEYLRQMLLLELASYFRFYGFMTKNRPLIEGAYLAIGAYDASLSVAGMVESEEVVQPSFVERVGDSRFKGLRHPLIEGSVENSIRLSRNAVITGTNMSGKTTFLRTVGLNQAVATGWGICFASSARVAFLQVVTAIRIEDSLLEGKSRYLAEAVRLLDSLRLARSTPSLFLVDEILTGTNSADRIEASVILLGLFKDWDSRVVATTHDREIALGLERDFNCFHFEEEIRAGDIRFDYRMKDGVVNARNALRILESLGFAELVGDVRLGKGV